MNKKHIGLIALVAFVAGSIPPFAKLALESFDPFTLVFFRFLAASVVTYFFMPRKELSFVMLKKMRWVGLIGALNPIFLFLGLRYIPANITPLLYAIVPGLSVMYLLIAKRNKVSRKNLLGFALGLVGVAIISLDTIITKSDSNPLLGVGFAAIAVLAFFAYSILSKEHQRHDRISATALAFYLTVITTIVSLPFALYETISAPWFHDVSLYSLLALLYIGFIGTGAQYLLYQRSLRVMEAAQANIFIYLQPVVTVLLAAVILGETISWQFITGGMIVLFGAHLALSRRKNVAVLPAEP